jgi:serine/threonine-protein kinase
MTDPTRPDGTRSLEGAPEGGSFVPEGGVPTLTGALERRLRIVRRLGDGGMGTVWEVEHLLTKHRRALKILHAEQAGRPDVVERFLREASVAGKLRSPHVVETFDAGVLEDGRPFVLMELIDGKSLHVLSVEGIGREPERVVRLLCQICEGMIVAHEKGVIHRDLKPENVIVTPDESVKILDFGISKFLEPEEVKASVTREGALIGTPHYMSPEQALGRTVDVRTDVYAIGAMAYELLSGKLPYDAPRLPELLIRIHEGKHLLLEELAPHVALPLASVVERAMHGNLESRYPTMKILRDALAPYCDADLARRSVGRVTATDQHAVTVAGAGLSPLRTGVSIDVEVDAPAGARPVSLDDDLTAPAPWTRKELTTPRPDSNELPTASVSTEVRARKELGREQTRDRTSSRTGIWVAVALVVVVLAGASVWAMSHATPQTHPTLPPATLAHVPTPPPPVTPPVIVVQVPPPVVPPPTTTKQGRHPHDVIDRTNPYGP